MNIDQPGRSRPTLFGPMLGVVAGLGIAAFGWFAPPGAARAYAYQSVQFRHEAGGGACPMVHRAEAVDLWPAGTGRAPRFVRLIEAPDCVAPRSQFSVRPRPMLKPFGDGRLRFAARSTRSGRRYTGVKARREPETSAGTVAAELRSFEGIDRAVGLVRGRNGIDWIEARMLDGRTVYLSARIVEFVPAR